MPTIQDNEIENEILIMISKFMAKIFILDEK